MFIEFQIICIGLLYYSLQLDSIGIYQEINLLVVNRFLCLGS